MKIPKASAGKERDVCAMEDMHEGTSAGQSRKKSAKLLKKSCLGTVKTTIHTKGAKRQLGQDTGWEGEEVAIGCEPHGEGAMEGALAVLCAHRLELSLARTKQEPSKRKPGSQMPEHCQNVKSR